MDVSLCICSKSDEHSEISLSIAKLWQKVMILSVGYSTNCLGRLLAALKSFHFSESKRYLNEDYILHSAPQSGSSLVGAPLARAEDVTSVVGSKLG